MNTITINSDIYSHAEQYAKMHNLSVEAVVEKGLSLLLGRLHTKWDVEDSAEFQEALTFVKTLSAKGGKPVPADENGLDSLIDIKYKL